MKNRENLKISVFRVLTEMSKAMAVVDEQAGDKRARDAAAYYLASI